MTPFIAETTTTTFEAWRSSADEASGVQHALGAKQRAAAEFQGDDVLVPYLQGFRLRLTQSRPPNLSRLLQLLLPARVRDSWDPLLVFRGSVSGGGLKEETHRQIRFRRWVGNFF